MKKLLTQLNTKQRFNLLVTAFLVVLSYSVNAQWNTTGNNAGSNLLLGTNDPGEGITLTTEGTPKLSLLSSGRLGLGTQSPNAVFEVNYCLPGSPNNGGFMVTKSLCPSGFTPVLFDPNTTLEVIGIPFDGIFPVETNSNQIKFPFNYLTGHTTNISQPLINDEGPLIWARTRGYNGWLFGTPDQFNTKFIVMPDGSCGINVAQPRAALDIRGAQKFNHPSAIIGSLAPGSYAMSSNGLPQYYTQQVQFVPNLTNDGFNRISQLSDQGMFFSDGQGTDGSNLDGAFILAPWAQEDDADIVGGMRMDANGNTEFHGTLRATKMNVDAKWWADFVFDTDYELMSLGELEKFIEVNNHLPNVPTEEEVLESGLDLANMQAIQQQKIEELTLYIIQLKNEMEALQATLESLK